MTVDLTVVDYINHTLLPDIEKIFDNEIKIKLEEQFDGLCTLMLSILDENVINVDKGIKIIMENFEGVDRNEVKKFI